MDDILLTEDQREWRRIVRQFVEREIPVEYVRACDRAREYPYEAYEKVAKAGWLGLLTSELTDDSEFDIFAYLILLYELGRYGVDFGTAFAIPAFSIRNIVHHGTPEHHRKYIVGFVKGEIRFSIAITEPDAGSDVAAVRTSAIRDGDEYVINGVKMFASAAHVRGNILCVLVRTDPSQERHSGLSLLLVPNDTPGLNMERLPTLARRATGTNQVYFDNVRVPVENRLGEEGEGWSLMTEHLEFERMLLATLYASNAQQAVTDALNYAKGRVQFGRPISAFQVIKHKLAQMQTDVDAAILLVHRAALLMDSGRPALREVSMAKLVASETLFNVASEGMQILGGAAQLPDMDLERYWREGQQAKVGGGSSQIQRSVIAKTMGV